MRQVVRMFKKLSGNCHDFVLHCQQSPNVTKEDKEACFDIFLKITKFLVDFVHFLRKTDDGFSEVTHSGGEHSASRN